MSFIALNGYIDLPPDQTLEDPHMGISFDYEFAGKRNGDQVSLLIHSWIIDHRGRVFSRKGSYFIPRVDAVEAITKHIKTHLTNMGVDDMFRRKLMRDFEVDNSKAFSYDLIEFPRKPEKRR